jgi:hypothetical protein
MLVVGLALALSLVGTGAVSGRQVLLPKSFGGSLGGSVHTSGWSYNSVAHFSGYDATFSISRLEFAPGAQGPFTVRSGTMRFSGFQVVETSPAGSSGGTCTARYNFELDHMKPFSANLGGFSLTGGTWHGEIALGIQTDGTVASATNCGPNLEDTQSEFGQPPRIALSFSAAGKLNPATGVLSVASKSTTVITGGSTQVAIVKGMLRGR